jgi:two-component system cell cycle response regulator DivK
MPRILMVDDDLTLREITERRVTKKGFEVLVVSNGAEGIALAKAERPELILMDMGMPVMDGFEAIKRLKADPETASIPVIAMTAFAMDDERERIFATGADDYESKPINLNQLVEKMNALLARGG